MADIHGSPGDAPQMPAAGSGPAPVPYGGADFSPEPPVYDVPAVAAGDPGGLVMAAAAGGLLQESPYAHDLDAGLVTPFYGGDISPVDAAGDADAGGRDDVAATVAGAVASAEARYHELQADTYGQGSTIGDLVDLTPVDSAATPAVYDPSIGLQPPSGSFL
jgi:hypothetical protein